MDEVSVDNQQTTAPWAPDVDDMRESEVRLRTALQDARAWIGGFSSNAAERLARQIDTALINDTRKEEGK